MCKISLRVMSVLIHFLCSDFMKTARRLTVLMDSSSDNVGL